MMDRITGQFRWEEATGIVIPHVPRKALVLKELQEHKGEWIEGWHLCHPDIGGSEGLRRLRELRADGWPIEGPKRIRGQATRYYRLVDRNPQWEGHFSPDDDADGGHSER